MTYTAYLENVLGIHEDTARLFDHTLCLEGGLGSDAVSALFAAKVGMPGFEKEFPADLSLYRVKVDRQRPRSVLVPRRQRHRLSAVAQARPARRHRRGHAFRGRAERRVSVRRVRPRPGNPCACA